MSEENQKTEGSNSKKLDLLIFSTPLILFCLIFYQAIGSITGGSIADALGGIFAILFLSMPYVFALLAFTGRTFSFFTSVRTEEGKAITVTSSAHLMVEIMFIYASIFFGLGAMVNWVLLLNIIPCAIGISAIEFLFLSGKGERWVKRVFELPKEGENDE